MPPFKFDVKQVGGRAMDFRSDSGCVDLTADGVQTLPQDDFEGFSAWLSESMDELASVPAGNVSCPQSDVEVHSPLFHVDNVSCTWPLDDGGNLERTEIISECPSPSLAFEPSATVPTDVPGPQPTVSSSQWQLGVAANYGQFAQHSSSLLLPWETGVFAEIFGSSKLLELPTNQLPEPDTELMEQVIAAVDTAQSSDLKPLDSCYDKAVRNVLDLDYFESKCRQLELACGQWLELLSCDWYSTGVGEILARDMQQDPTGSSAFETLKACFGIKSPQTLIKRASSLKRYYKWHSELRADAGSVHLSPLPLVESDVWSFFQWLRDARCANNRGFTNTSAFLETVRFMKFTVELREADSVLQSRRLLGFAAIERMKKGPTRQALPLELIHLQRLHDVLENGTCATDRLGAGVMLVCIYGRARWSDLRFIHHVVVEEGRNGFLTLFTSEHKTSAVGVRREQYLPLVVPWMGVTHDEWVQTFLQVYKQCGLDISKVPLGPLLPAPRLGGTFGARPLSTPEAADWLRLLLSGTPDCEKFRAHSLKTTLLVWAAKAGLDKEVRAVLGHHASALQGSEVVYSRHLQTRALRKLNMLLHRVRIGLGLEEDPMAPNPFATPCARTPRPGLVGAQPVAPLPPVPVVEQATDVVARAAEEVNAAGDAESVKEELLDETQICAAASRISLFDLQVVDTGVIELNSSSGSESSSDSSSSSSSDEVIVKRPDVHAFVEIIPDGFEFYKHKKSAIVHKVKCGQRVAACGTPLTSNLQQMPREIKVRWPKCLKCFPKDGNRIRDISQLTGALDAALNKARRR